jgi:hypothetical protein
MRPTIDDNIILWYMTIYIVICYVYAVLVLTNIVYIHVHAYYVFEKELIYCKRKFMCSTNCHYFYFLKLPYKEKILAVNPKKGN